MLLPSSSRSRNSRPPPPPPESSERSERPGSSERWGCRTRRRRLLQDHYSGILECPCNSRFGGDDLFYGNVTTSMHTLGGTKVRQ